MTRQGHACGSAVALDCPLPVACPRTKTERWNECPGEKGHALHGWGCERSYEVQHASGSAQESA